MDTSRTWITAVVVLAWMLRLVSRSHVPLGGTCASRRDGETGRSRTLGAQPRVTHRSDAQARPSCESQNGTAMLRKRIALLRRRADLTREQFDAHWAGPHAPLIRRLPGLQRYVQNHVVAAADNTIDGVVEVWFDDAAVSSPEAHFSSEQTEDELRFLSGLSAFVVDDTGDYDPPAKVWAILRERTPGSATAATAGLRKTLPASEIRANRRLTDVPAMSRPDLICESPLPDVLLTVCFDSVDDALAARDRVESLLSGDDALDGVRLLTTTSLRFV